MQPQGLSTSQRSFALGFANILAMLHACIFQIKGALRASYPRCYLGREGERGYFTALNSLAYTRENPRFRRFMPLQVACSDLSENA